MAVIDWSDPCARADAFRDAYYRLVAGGTETMIRYRGPEGEREVRFGKTDLSTLRSEWFKAIDECRASNSQPPRPRQRFAITAGSRRKPFRFS